MTQILPSVTTYIAGHKHLSAEKKTGSNLCSAPSLAMNNSKYNWTYTISADPNVTQKSDLSLPDYIHDVSFFWY